MSFWVQIIFYLISPEKHTDHQSKCWTNFLQYFLPLFLLTSNLGFPPTHPCYRKSISATEAQKQHSGVRDEHKVIPSHPSLPSCHLLLRQLHFLSSSLGINSCIPTSCLSQGEGCALPKVERNHILIFSGEYMLIKRACWVF